MPVFNWKVAFSMADGADRPDAAADGQRQAGPSWDDLKALVAVAAHGSMNQAGRSLGESQATIGRRMRRLEDGLGVPLLKRGVNAVTLLPAGLDLLRAIAPMAEAVQDIDAAMRPHKPAYGGLIRLTATNTLSLFLSRHIQELNDTITPRQLVLLPTRRTLDLAAGEAELALRMRNPPRNTSLLARKLGTVGFAVYGVRSHLGLPVIMPSADAAVSRQRERAEAMLDERPRGPQIDELHLRLQAIKAGVGVGLLPCWVGDGEVDLVRVPPVDRLIIHEDIYLIRMERSRSDLAVTALAEALAVLLRRHRAALTGKATVFSNGGSSPA
jgi:DNA-binding transcriptional LysR family regulator